jgi:Holliday junction resolvase RusA-like endonuclease
VTREGVTFRIDGEAVPKGRPRVSRTGTYTPARTVAYRDEVQAAYLAVARRYNRDDQGRYAVTIQVVTASRRRSDLDNIAKAILDALNGVAFGDDSQVDRLVVTRHFGETPLTRVLVEKVPDPAYRPVTLPTVNI